VEIEDNKSVIRRFFQEVFNGEQNLAVVDDVFASDHILRGPKLGTGEVVGTGEFKEELAQYAGATCIIERQIAEGDWVTTIYTLKEENQDHMGVMISRITDGKIQESFIIARSIPVSESEWTLRTIIN
jgi:predicted SnoaL-like aldol condensation-catalyzing enzyme